MKKQEQLNQIKEMLAIISDLDDSYGIEKSSLTQLYGILSELSDEETFNETYKAILGNLNIIFDKLERFEKNIVKKLPNRREIKDIVKKKEIKVNLSAMKNNNK